MHVGSRSLRVSGLLGLLLTIVIILSAAPRTWAVPDLIVTVGDTTGHSGQKNSVITVYLNNFHDSVAAFTLWIQTDRPDIMKFQTDTMTIVDTTYWICHQYSGPNCLDSTASRKDSTWNIRHIDTVLATVGNIDTVGCLTHSWDYINTRSLSGQGTDLLVTGIARTYGGPTRPPILPQSGGVLFKLRGDILHIPDTATQR
ncbi:MAG TPA: hypothetical protein VMS71_04995, partial [Candidatus Acidoferrum sp.]|nr:hypothetical protein [Candidatus Acidoferrum sp.]